MAQLKPTRTVYTVTEFLDWQRSGSLVLKPIFQRREVWDPKAKSMLIDTVVKGLPVPIIFLRRTQDLAKLKSTLEVVDGQQRLRTLFSFIDPSVLPDFSGQRDSFVVRRIHNKSIAEKTFSELPEDVKEAILGYEISTHVFPANTEDEVILRIFARINSTGAKLNPQELRNAYWFGSFKTLSYELAIQHLPQWRRWGIFSDDDFARMNEVESVSDYLLSMMNGIQGKSQKKLDNAYEQYDDEFPGSEILARKFQNVMHAVDDSLGAMLANTRLRRQALFYSLLTAVYDHMYGLSSSYDVQRQARSLPTAMADRVTRVNERILAGELPEDIQDAMDKATADKGRRETRHKFFMEALGLAAAS
jgi:hypothetical protein